MKNTVSVFIFTIICLVSLVVLFPVLLEVSKPVLVVETDKSEYLGYDFVNIRGMFKHVKPSDRLKETPFKAVVLKEHQVVSTIGGQRVVTLRYNSKNGWWEGKWPVPWNAQEGDYTINVGVPLRINHREVKVGRMATFKIAHRKPPAIDAPLLIVDWEKLTPLKKLRIKNSEDKIGDWKNIFNWIEWLGGNTLWWLGGQTAAYDKPINEEFPWYRENFRAIPKIIQEAHQRKVKVGAWAAGYLTYGPRKFANQNYKYAWDYSPSLQTCIPTRAVSLADGQRLKDIISFLKELNNMEGLDYIGLDYLRNALGGYELVDEFVQEMNSSLPANWSAMLKLERMAWLARKVRGRRTEDMNLIDQWNWWRARQTALIVQKIKEEIRFKKPFWVFCLAWEKGWQHGQDPVMLTDAGADLIAVMLYQANREQLDNFIKRWYAYINKNNNLNLVVGNEFDWPLHQYTMNPPGPEEFYDRLVSGAEKISPVPSLVKGVFLHDLSRAFWGRKGPYSTKEWLIAGARVFSQFARKQGALPTATEIFSPDTMSFSQKFVATIKIANLANTKLNRMKFSFFTQPDISLEACQSQELHILPPGGEQSIPVQLKVVEPAFNRDGWYMLATRITWQPPDSPVDDGEMNFKYIQVKNLPAQTTGYYE